MTYQILIAEDNPDQIKLLSIFLKKSLKNCNLDFVRSGAEFLKRLAPKYSMVILDYLLPDMTGLDLLADCRKIQPDLPAVVITAFDDKKLFNRLNNYRVSAIILKNPDYFNALIRVIKNILT